MTRLFPGGDKSTGPDTCQCQVEQELFGPLVERMERRIESDVVLRNRLHRGAVSRLEAMGRGYRAKESAKESAGTEGGAWSGADDASSPGHGRRGRPPQPHQPRRWLLSGLVQRGAPMPSGQ